MSEQATDHAQASLNIPQLVAFVVISALIVRWLFFSSSSAANGAGSNNTHDGTSSSSLSSSSSPTHVTIAGRRIAERHVEQIQVVFPQYNRREILWDLVRNGGSPAATMERILGGRGLDTPPPAFQPPPSPTRQHQQHQEQRALARNLSSLSGTTGSSNPSTSSQGSSHPNLISRYNLSSKIDPARRSKTGDDDKPSTSSGWSQNRDDRQAILQRRREEMILSARNKLLQKDRRP